MFIISSLVQAVKNFGINHAIDALDNIEKPFGEEIEAQKKKIEQMDSQQLAKWIIDRIQQWLRAYFKIEPPLPPDNV